MVMEGDSGDGMERTAGGGWRWLLGSQALTLMSTSIGLVVPLPRDPLQNGTTRLCARCRPGSQPGGRVKVILDSQLPNK